MNDLDKKEFKDTFDGLSDYYQRSKLEPIALRMYFSGLADYSIGEVQSAIASHMKNPKNGQFYPKIADIVGFIEGGDVTADMVISAARLSANPFGVLCAMQIGHWDLTRGDTFLLKQRAQECIDMMPHWKELARLGNYSQHTVDTMIKYDVRPDSPFRDGLAPPRHNPDLQLKISQGTETLRLESIPEKQPELEVLSDEELEIQKAQVTRLLEELATDKKVDYQFTYTTCGDCSQEYEDILENCPQCEATR
jgi:hypothetical protein